MTSDWYYADSSNQQQGPVEAAALAGLFRSGSVNAATLVWREGLAAWVPLQQVAAQLGLIIVGAATPVAQATSAARIVKPTGGKTSAWVIVAIVLGCSVPFLGILAAIALPAYQDYVMRAKVAEAVVLASGLKVAVAEFYQSENHCPRNGDSGFEAADTYATQTVASIAFAASRSGACDMRLTLRGATALQGKYLQFSMDRDGRWRTSSDLPPRYLPTSMR